MAILTNIKAAAGEIASDILLKNCKLVNVLSGEVNETNIAIKGTKIVGIGSDYNAEKEIDLKGKYVAPGFIDSHLHIESSMVSIPEYAKTVVPKGTTTIICDPHEIANVMGLAGITYMLQKSKHEPLTVYFMLPSCVPATNMETSGSRLSADDLSVILNSKWILGLGEMMNFPGVIHRMPDVMEKILLAHENNMPIDGHAPLLTGKQLCAYIAAGINSDHECTNSEEALEKLRKGMFVMIREGTTEKNLEELVKLVKPENARRFLFATDDRHPEDLIKEGHIDFLIKKSIRLGVEPINAFQIATLNAAERFNLQRIGAIVPGYWADIVVIEDLENFKVKYVYKGGQLVAVDGQLIYEYPQSEETVLRSSVNIHKNFSIDDIKLKSEGKRIRVIDIVPDQIITKQSIVEPKVENDYIISDIENDILKVVVVERHQASGNVGIGFVKGFGLKEGAIASSIAHDSHNIIAVGTSDEDIYYAINRILNIHGGCSVTSKNKVLAELQLPIAGLMSSKSLEFVNESVKNLNEKAKSIGSLLPDPFMTMSFIALPVIPDLKITDKGLFDVLQFKSVSVFE